MTDLTSELNLIQAEDDDDTADYLTQDLRSSLAIVDGLFNNLTGHTHSGAHQGAVLGASALVDNTIPGAKLVDASVTYAKLAANLLESLYTGSLVWVTTNTTVQVISPVLYVFCNAAVTITLTAGINRPVTVAAFNGNCTVTSTSGSVFGGSVDTASGTVINGRVNTGDALTYKWDATNWRAV